jgi:uncharacterized phage protein gp47/JayE
MPLTLRPKDTILTTLIDSVLAGDIITDVSQISVVRQLAEGAASSLADLGYDLYTLLQSFYLSTSHGNDLDTRGRDQGLVRDPGQAASDTVTFTRVQTWIEDIPLPAPQVLQATLADGTVILYRSLGNAHLWPQGRSLSAPAPGTICVSGQTDQLQVNLDGDGAQTITLGSQTTGVAIAAAIQTAVRGLTAIIPGNQPAYDGFRCDYSTTTAGAYTLRSGTTGPTSRVIVTAGTHDATIILKLGVAQGGTEVGGQDSVDVSILCDQIGIIGNIGAGQIHMQVTPVQGILSVANALMFANGREPASDDAYRQDLQNYLLALGRGTRNALERAVYGTISPDGTRHVMSAQVVYGVGMVQVFVCDGRSLTVGAQADVVQAVQDELDGHGVTVGGWVPAGAVAGVAPATVATIPVTVTVFLGPTPDLVLAQQALQTALYTLLYQWPVGTSLSYAQMTRRIDQTVAEMLGVTYTLPAAFADVPPPVIPGIIGQKLMPGVIAVEVERA